MLKRLKVATIPLCVLLLLAGCRAQDGAEDSALGPVLDHAANRHGGPGMVTQPMHGEWESTESPPSPNPPAGCTVYIQTGQAGHGTHLGTFRGTGVTCANPVGPPTATPPFWDRAPAPPYLVATFTAEMVWTAANGDELWVRAEDGVFVQSLANGAAMARGTLAVTGGTGRFEGASGELAVESGRGPGEPGDHATFDGSITVQAGLGSARS